LIAESLWPNSAYSDGRGINTLIERLKELAKKPSS
jgi:hypothetical protein